MINRLYLVTLFVTFSSLTLLGQNNTIWTSFWNKDTTMIGYKDHKGIIKIEPKFTNFTNARKFENIIAVSEEADGSWKNYYLTKSGKIVGIGNLHIFDNGFDCESEGFIRFRDKETGNVGMFDRNGTIAIPALYNELTRVRNGMIIGLKNAQKEHAKNDNHTGCDHSGWKGGEEVLLDTLNTILVENFNYDDSINFFSLEKSNTPSNDTIRKSFLGKNGTYYSFIDFEKEFKQWISKVLVKDLTKEELINISYQTITWESKDGWAKTKREKLITDNFEVLKNGLLETTNPKTNYFISSDGLNQFMYDEPEFDKYYNNCGESKDWMYPTLTLIINNRVKKDLQQNHYEFLRTDNGYKLLSLSIRNKKIK